MRFFTIDLFRTSTVHSLFPSIGFAAIAALAAPLFGACTASVESDCERWWAAGEALSECSLAVLPPSDGPANVVCLTDDELAAGGVVSSLDECIAYFDEHTERCWPLPFDDPRTAACTSGALRSWEPSSDPDACKRWKHAARAHAWCDPSVFPPFDDDAECVSDETLAARGGPFETVGDCADFLLGQAYPCRVPLGERREACGVAAILR